MPLPRQCFSRWAIFIIVGCFVVVVVTCGTYFGLTKRKHHSFDWTAIVSHRGDVLPDFSFAGYHASAIILPSGSGANVTLAFNGSVDDVGPLIQEAVDKMAALGGGAVLLPEGRWPMSAGVNITSNVVVAGAGSEKTVLVLQEPPSQAVFTLGTPNNGTKPQYGFRSNITNDYAPIGSSSLDVVDSAGFAADQLVYVSRSVTESWIRENGMSGLVRDDAEQTWIPVGKRIMAPNQISSVYGTNVTLKIPLTDNLDSEYTQPELIVYTPPYMNEEMGIRDMSIEVPDTCSGAPMSDKTCNSPAIHFPSWTVDSWASGLSLKGFNKFFQIDTDASRITIQNCTMNRDKDIEGAALPFDILIQGSQVLVQDCAQVGSPDAKCFTVGTGSLTPGPNAVLRHKAKSDVQTIYPHQRWAHGLLVEDSSVKTLFVDRGIKGSGHGWSINGGVGWNLDGSVDFESPPLGINWCVGCNDPQGNATFIESGKRVDPESLFMAQLEGRNIYRHNQEDEMYNE
ncbi:uncharacterized protein FIESC28_00802 [Fusarium coffeatum]|uniref:Pectate lyase superfamily protein domain-containing protein n=1 Tax=Fusarium coffeatum TaxID=231269 RepID=A0A366SAN9_9HYPO|nr:uncharacterized protein FIESC28_00802 [Fusarium coffeatum]RBR26397.1 hypothetical protein FIESC28_00802 [Fusarium coffeatum]